jgi:hypothetical protein
MIGTIFLMGQPSACSYQIIPDIVVIGVFCLEDSIFVTDSRNEFILLNLELEI